MGRRIRVSVAVSLAALLLVTGCTSAKKTSTLKPKVTPPAIAKAGVLKVGVDLSYPPFAGTDAGKQAGIDVDVASALAGKLGLTVKLVDVKPADAAKALSSGKADVVLSVPLTAEALSGAAIAGTYISDGPALFVSADASASIDPTLTIDSLGSGKVGAQKESVAYWAAARELGGEQAVTGYATLREALDALAAGDVDVVAGDAIVGAYIARDMSQIHFAGQGADATLLGVAVNPDNTTLSEKMRDALDQLAADGVLDTVRRKWVGDLPELKVSDEASASDGSAQ